MMIYEKSAGVIIFYRKQGKLFFLLLKYKTYWGFVKGNIEENENLKETAIREAKEETSLENLKFISGFQYNQNWFYKMNRETRRKEAVFFLAEISESDAKKVKLSFEHEGFKWVSFEEAMQLMKIKNNKEMLTSAYEFIKEHSKQKKLF
jgi:8-oxo-dGTP pyrophosphatase MutT (NUDIX family)